jgi:hypothetical protein
MMPRVALTLACGLLLASAGRANPDADEALRRLANARESGNVAAICRAVHAMGDVEDAKIQKQLRKIASRDRDDRVVAAAARELGEDRQKKDLRLLTRLVKSYRKRPRALEGVLEALGQYGSPRSVDLLYDQIRYFMSRHKGATLAAIEALGRVRTREAVERLIDAMNLTQPRMGMGAQGKDVDGFGSLPGITSDDTVASLSAYRPDIARSLRRLTGEPLESPEDWREWWLGVRKTFRPPEPEDEGNLQLAFRDGRARYAIRRPSGKWRWVEKTEDGFDRTAERRVDGRRVAWLSIHVHAVEEAEPSTVKGLLEEQEDRLKDAYRIYRATWNEPARLGGKAASGQTVECEIDDRQCRLAQAAIKHRGRLYLVRWAMTEGAGYEEREELEKFVESFELLD